MTVCDSGNKSISGIIFSQSHPVRAIGTNMFRPRGSPEPKNLFKAPFSIDPSSEPNDTSTFLQSMNDTEVIERLRVVIKNAHVFKLPTRQTVSVGWRGADWKEKVWQGTIKVVDRVNITAVLLVEPNNGCIFAVCPVKEGSIERCVDSSRYFVLKIENSSGRHMFIGVAFNERNDAFDFNTALEDARREKQAELIPPVLLYNGPKLLSFKEGEKIHVSVPKTGASDKGPMSLGGTEAFDKFNSLPDTSDDMDGLPIYDTPNIEKKQEKKTKGIGTGFLKPSSKDTPSRR
jgi:hypothetical protein